MREIKFEERAVAFLDILGFTDFIKKAEKSESDEYKKLCKLQEVIEAEIEANGFHPRLKPDCKFFSDSVILSAVVDKNNYAGLVGVTIKTIQITHQLLRMGFLVRGGIAVGLVSHSERNIFGTGYVDAYETESKLAVTPRILLHKSAAKILDEGGLSSGWPIKTLTSFLREGEQWIVDMLNPHENYIPSESQDAQKLFEGYRSTIIENLRQHALGSSVRSKWEWMAEFFNWKLKDSSQLSGLEQIAISSITPFKRENIETHSGTSFIKELGMRPMIGVIRVPH